MAIAAAKIVSSLSPVDMGEFKRLSKTSYVLFYVSLTITLVLALFAFVAILHDAGKIKHFDPFAELSNGAAIGVTIALIVLAVLLGIFAFFYKFVWLGSRVGKMRQTYSLKNLGNMNGLVVQTLRRRAAEAQGEQEGTEMTSQ